MKYYIADFIHMQAVNLPEGWTASIDEELMEGPTSLTEDTEKWKVWQVRAWASDTLWV